MCKDCKGTISKTRYDEIVKRANERGLTVITKWRKGLKHIRLGDIVLKEF